MDATIITSDDHDSYVAAIKKAAAALRDGALVVFPTETVYGVGANALDTDAVARLREVKGRAHTQAFTAHFADRSDARQFVGSPSPLARRLARKAWPGPLTLICPVTSPEKEKIARRCPPERLADIYRNGKVGLRCPAHTMASEFLRATEVPVLASSANRAGNPPPLELKDALRDLDSSVEYALDGGRTRFNESSTIVEIDGCDWTVRRTGVIDERTIKRMATTLIVMVCTGNSCRSPIAEYLFRENLAKRMKISVKELARQGYVVSSAGTVAFPGGSISSGSFDELRSRKIDASGHRSQPLTIELIQQAERIYTMSPEHRAAVLDLVPAAADRVFPLDPRGPVADPIGGGANEYKACATVIEEAVDARLEEFLNEDLDW